MQGRELIMKQLDLLVEMSEHCRNMPKLDDRAKCANCGLHWNFNLECHGCFLVKVLDNNDFIDYLECACSYHDIEYIDKFNKIAGIFNTESE